MRCGDCGAVGQPMSKARPCSVCARCFEARGTVLQAVKEGVLSLVDFRSIQKAMANRRGSAKRIIARLLDKNEVAQ